MSERWVMAMLKPLLMRIITAFAVIFAIGFSGNSAFAAVADSYEINGSTFVLNYTSKNGVTYNKMLLDKPSRLVVDVIGVDKCKFCKPGIMVVEKSANSKIKMGYHDSKKDFLYKLYKKPTLRIVFEFDTKNKIPQYNLMKSKNRLIVSFAGISKKDTIIERVSFRKFKKYEMIVALLNKKPVYQVTKNDGTVYLTIKGAVPLKAALTGQNVSGVSATIESFTAKKIGSEIVRYAIKLKPSAHFLKAYSDKRHIYLIFNSPALLASTGGKKQIKPAEGGTGESGGLPRAAATSKEKATPVISGGTSEKSSVIISANTKLKKKKKYTGKKISFDVRNADIKDIFRVFAKISGLNFITSDDVHGTLTMELHDVPWDQAFDLILQQKGLVAEREGNIIRITTAAKYQQEKKQELQAIRENQALERAKNAVTEVINLNYITPDYAIKIINDLLYGRQTGKNTVGFIVADVKNNSLICHDTPKNIEKIKRIIAAIDRKKRAIEIDARIVEINKSFERQLGIQWGGSFENFYQVASSTHTFIGVGGATPPTNPFNPGLPQENFIVNLPTTLSDAPTAGVLSLLVGKSNYNIDLKLTAGEIEGYSKVLSSPRVITMDNEPAKIESGQQIPYQQSAGASGATSVTFKSATLSLEVTPHITNNNKIILKIKVSKDSADFAHAVNGEPPINTNSVQTTVVLNNGQTVVLGGLIQKTNLRTTSGVPGLMRIPLLGWLFKTKRYYNPESELFIFVTPKIVQ